MCVETDSVGFKFFIFFLIIYCLNSFMAVGFNTMNPTAINPACIDTCRYCSISHKIYLLFLIF